ncbi:hypothetical protein HMPREF0083_05892 [Aneurinibacillus aneurinilyticus ATCC 12856]|uniref:Uncharacterized protein n=1 Tax=Aneurinibacillus aneurinilyticus ATCC 12856 TaxID=649747 RepID=U1WRJ6_ANEAE|nr:hypothetical protein HMPREF0083_05892 [Aneurinibacillus aneurinilyticus ATCC 12856]
MQPLWFNNHIHRPPSYFFISLFEMVFLIISKNNVGSVDGLSFFQMLSLYCR